MRKISNLIGMPVVCHRKKIGRLVQADLSKDLTRLQGIWVDGGFRGTRYISAEHLGMIGDNAILADSPGKRKRCKAARTFLRAVTTDGRRLGAVTGAMIDEMSFLVESLEITRGTWDDLYSGRLQIRSFTVNDHRSEVIVANSAQSEFEEEQT